MSDFLPTVDGLISLPTHIERVDWLIRCPDGIYAGHPASIRTALERVGFTAAIPYLLARAAAQWANHTADGGLPKTVLMAIYVAESDMKAAAKYAEGNACGR